MWSKTYNTDTEFGSDSPFDFKPLHDGSYALTGKACTRLHVDLWLSRADSGGNVIWENFIGEEDVGGDDIQFGKSICETDDNVMGVVGGINGRDDDPDIFFVLADTAGNVLLRRSYGSSNRYEEGVDICQTEGGFAILGQEGGYEPGDGSDYFLIKINEQGDSLWSRTYGQEGKFYTSAQILPLSDGGFLLFGGRLEDINNPYSPSSICIIRTDSTGEVVWERTYDHEEPVGILQTAEDEFVILNDAPVLMDEGWVEGMQLFWIDGEGNEVYTSDPILTPNRYPLTRDFVQATDGGFIVCGGNFRIIRTDADGNELYQEVYGDTAEGQGSSAYVICTTSDSGFAMGGFGPGGGVLLMRLGPEVWPNTVREPDAAPQVFMLYPAYPNPFNAHITIPYSVPFTTPVSLEVYDLSGRFVTAIANEPVSGRNYQRAVWDAQQQPAGVYLIRMNAPEFNGMQKVVLIK
jgi:hypothetical protein